MNTLGVILARGGSRRVPRKNVRELKGQPLMVWTIAAASWATLLDRFVVSSEDDEILQVAKNCRVETVKRPMELATDSADSYGAMLHALDEVDEPYDYLCLLQPTSPFRLPTDIDRCIATAYNSEKPAAVTVEAGQFVPNGAVYVGRTDWLRDGGNFDSSMVTEKVFMPADRSIDIDTEEDFLRAEGM